VLKLQFFDFILNEYQSINQSIKEVIIRGEMEMASLNVPCGPRTAKGCMSLVAAWSTLDFHLLIYTVDRDVSER
jgi:hypothetical protein